MTISAKGGCFKADLRYVKNALILRFFNLWTLINAQKLFLFWLETLSFKAQLPTFE